MLRIELDPQGAPHWLSELRKNPRLWLRWWRLRVRESRAFLKAHGPIVKVEDMPRRPRRK